MRFAKMYVRLIKKGLKTFDNVPEKLRDMVRELLQAEGLEHLATIKQTKPMEHPSETE